MARCQVCVSGSGWICFDTISGFKDPGKTGLPVNPVNKEGLTPKPGLAQIEKIEYRVWKTMTPFSFYEIKSQKSKEFVNGVRKTSLACLNHPEMHIFLWLDENETLKQAQFIFDENLLEWAEGQTGLTASETNRKAGQFSQRTGMQKGARTIHSSRDLSILKRGLQIINKAQFPESYAGMIRKKLLQPYLKKPNGEKVASPGIPTA